MKMAEGQMGECMQDLFKRGNCYLAPVENEIKVPSTIVLHSSRITCKITKVTGL